MNLWDHLSAAIGKIAAGITVAAGAAIGYFGGDGLDISQALGDALAGAVTGGTVVLIAALTVRWVNAIADRREKSAESTVDDYRELLEETRQALGAERTENQALRAEVFRLLEENQALRARFTGET